METVRIAAAGLTALAALSLAGEALAQPSDRPPEPLTERHETFDSAVATPAEDLNLKHVQIPEVLQRAAINPYDMRTMDACNAIRAEVERLDAALGADRDEQPTPDTRTVDEKRDSTAASVLKLGIEAVTPYRGIVRWVTGADAHDKSVQDTIEAGFARRGFLKGMAVSRNCAPPASPAWFRPAQTAQYQPVPAPAPARQYYQAYPAAPRYGAYDDRTSAPARSQDDDRSYSYYPADRDDQAYRAYRGDRYDQYDRYDR